MKTTPVPQRYAFGAFQLDAARRVLRRGDAEVPLKPKAFDLLTHLVVNADRVVTKDELMAALWPDHVVDEANLTQTIYELRRALGDSVDAIETVPRRGYRFAGEVRGLIDHGEADAPLRSIAVLPFRQLGGGKGEEYLELGIAETLISALIESGGIAVRPATAIARYSEGAVDPLKAAHELGVDAVVEGSLQRAGTRLRVNARVVRRKDGSTVWAQRFDEREADIFALQDAIAERLVAALLGRSSPGGRSMQRRESVEVHHLFLKCRYYWHKWTPQAWLRSIEYGRQAIALDPEHAQSHAWMAASYCALGTAGVVAPREAFGEARRLVSRALDPDDTLSVAHEVLGAIRLFFDWDWASAETSLRRALELNPANAGARDLLALLFVLQRRNDEAILTVRRALEDDPLSLLMNTDAGWILYFARRYDEALEQLQRTLELDPHFGHARACRGYVLVQMRRTEEAVAEMLAASQYSGTDPQLSADVAYARAMAGDETGAREILEAMRASRGSLVDPFRYALVHVGLGEYEKAIPYVEQAVEHRSREVVYMRANPAFDELRKRADCERFLGPLGV